MRARSPKQAEWDAHIRTRTGICTHSVCVCGWQTMMVFYVVKIARMNWNAHPTHTIVAIYSSSIFSARRLSWTDDNHDNEKYSNQPRRRRRRRCEYTHTHTPSTLDFLNKQNKSAPVIMGVIETKIQKKDEINDNYDLWNDVSNCNAPHTEKRCNSNKSRALWASVIVCVSEWVLALKASYWRNHKLLFI